MNHQVVPMSSSHSVMKNFNNAARSVAISILSESQVLTLHIPHPQYEYIPIKGIQRLAEFSHVFHVTLCSAKFHSTQIRLIRLSHRLSPSPTLAGEPIQSLFLTGSIQGLGLMSYCFTSPKYWGDFISNRYLKVMWNKSPKWDIYQTLFNPNKITSFWGSKNHRCHCCTLSPFRQRSACDSSRTPEASSEGEARSLGLREVYGAYNKERSGMILGFITRLLTRLTTG